FDPSQTTFRSILEFFFQIHDPTTMNRQGNDGGGRYRSAIFYTSDEQKQTAEDTIADVDASGIWPGKVVTEVTAAGPFWEAEPEHQDYLQRIPNGYTCHFVRPNWRLPSRKTVTGHHVLDGQTHRDNPATGSLRAGEHQAHRRAARLLTRDRQRAAIEQIHERRITKHAAVETEIAFI